MIYGYARVSSTSQNEARQVEALEQAGAEYVLIDKKTGKDFNRPQYQTMLAHLHDGDTVIVTSIDRIGRQYSGITEEWRRITQEKKANIKVLDMPLLDTTNSGENLDGRFIADLVLQILCYVSEKERHHIRERQRQGIEIMKKKGVKPGRPPMKRPDNFLQVYEQWKTTDMTAKAAMKQLGLKPSMFYRFVERHEKELTSAQGDV